MALVSYPNERTTYRAGGNIIIRCHALRQTGRLRIRYPPVYGSDYLKIFKLVVIICFNHLLPIQISLIAMGLVCKAYSHYYQ